MTTIIKIIFDFEEDVDLSYVKVEHDMSREALIDFIECVDDALIDDDNDACESIYSKLGHNVDTLMTKVCEKDNTVSYEKVLAVTLPTQTSIQQEPNFDVELDMW